jgi:hypothetical protein
MSDLAAIARIRAVGRYMPARLGLTLTATPSESRPTTSPDRKALADTRPSDAAESDTQRAPAR